MNRVVLFLALQLPLVLVSILGALFVFTPDAVADLAANSVDVRLVEPWRVGTTLLLCAIPLLAATVYATRNTLHSDQVNQSQV